MGEVTAGVVLGLLLAIILLRVGAQCYRASEAEYKQKFGYEKLRKWNNFTGNAKIVDGRFVCRDCRAPLTDRNWDPAATPEGGD